PWSPVLDGKAAGPRRRRGARRRRESRREAGVRRGAPAPASLALRGSRAPDAGRRRARPALPRLSTIEPADLGALPAVGLAVDARSRARRRRLSAQSRLALLRPVPAPHRRGRARDGRPAQPPRARAAGRGLRQRAASLG